MLRTSRNAVVRELKTRACDEDAGKAVGYMHHSRARYSRVDRTGKNWPKLRHNAMINFRVSNILQLDESFSLVKKVNVSHT